MNRDYATALNSVKTNLIALAPTRVVSRTLKDLDQHTKQELAAGIYMIVPDGIRDYPYEHSDAHDGINAPSQTDLGNFQFVIIGRGSLSEKATGEEIDAAEIAMINELENLADQAIGIDELKDLQILRSEMSGQLIAPYFAVATRWRVRLFD